jgi:hypothetical protein
MYLSGLVREYNYLGFGIDHAPLVCQSANLLRFARAFGAVRHQTKHLNVLFGLNYRFGPGWVVAKY